MTEGDVIKAIRSPGRFDATATSEAEAKRLVRAALPGAVEIAPADSGQAYPTPPTGIKTWYQVHPAEPSAGFDLPHVKYADWSNGKKGRGGSWGHVFFPPGGTEQTEVADVVYV
jgi:hypothetical protein